MDKLPRFAKVFAGRRRIVEMDISLRLRNLAEFFNSLLGVETGQYPPADTGRIRSVTNSKQATDAQRRPSGI